VSASPSDAPTSLTLLQRLQQPGASAAWGRFAELYTPLLFYWASQAGLQEADAADLVQEVFLVLIRQLPEFHYQPGGSFRGWLRTVLANKWREQQRRKALPVAPGFPVEEVAAAPTDDPLDDPKCRIDLVHRTLVSLRDEFTSSTWTAFHQVVVVGKTAPVVAAELGLSVAAVYIAKSRVLKRLRQELGGLID
jgi:RNA polymerase sigma-70 factor (ECF subfamily)